ncbi:MAG: hypothetical protein PF482_19545 [Desulfobacteraceae bacterium]|jgi:hypothetical protein|nr:hypothetical protein [Desulfobacteraceae bacterium]
MEKRIVRLEDDLWRIRTDTGELPVSERNFYLSEMKDRDHLDFGAKIAILKSILRFQHRKC